MVIDLSKESTYLNWHQWILSVFGWPVGEGKSLAKNCRNALEILVC